MLSLRVSPLAQSLLLFRYFVTVAFPVVCFGAIYADYTHTQEWKRKQQQQQIKSEASSD